MSKATNSANFRNPAFIFMFYLFLMLPYFAFLCSVDFPTKYFWVGIKTCTNEFIVSSFIENSIWSLVLIVFIFETLNFGIRKFTMGFTPSSFSEWLRMQSGAFFLLMVPFFIWVLLSMSFESITASLEKEFPKESLVQSFLKVQIIGLLALNLNFYLENLRLKKNPLFQNLSVFDGIKYINVKLESIKWVEKIEKNYFIFSQEGKFQIFINLKDMEKKLPKQHFQRINRSVIINLNEVNSFSFWENEKYVLKLKTNKEFIVTRKRILELKKVLGIKSKKLNSLDKFTFSRSLK